MIRIVTLWTPPIIYVYFGKFLSVSYDKMKFGMCHLIDENSWLMNSRFARSQWETALLCNDVSHSLGASLESALRTCVSDQVSMTWISNHFLKILLDIITYLCFWYTCPRAMIHDIVILKSWLKKKKNWLWLGTPWWEIDMETHSALLAKRSFDVTVMIHWSIASLVN